jgi:diadenosine tetraphosphatase ApaH/serine/threonine PP2A family protein phosphatase
MCRKLGVSKIYCLGDVVGYGPAPRECIKKVQEFEVCLKGNHEAALLYYPNDFNPHAKVALDWTRDQINSKNYPREENFALWDWLDRLPEVARTDRFMLVHGSPRDPVREYMLPHDVRDVVKMREVFSMIDRPFCMVGHSHIPGVYTEDLQFISPLDLEEGYKPGAEKTLVNVGSLGQPRDGDPRACFATWDGEVLRFRRVEYNVQKTMDLILETKILPKILALRLQEGR